MQTKTMAVVHNQNNKWPSFSIVIAVDKTGNMNIIPDFYHKDFPTSRWGKFFLRFTNPKRFIIVNDLLDEFANIQEEIMEFIASCGDHKPPMQFVMECSVPEDDRPLTALNLGYVEAAYAGGTPQVSELDGKIDNIFRRIKAFAEILHEDGCDLLFIRRHL